VGPLGTAAANTPIVPAPGDYDDREIGRMMIDRGNRSTRRIPAPVPLCPPQTPHACPDANPGRRGGKPATNRLSYGTACVVGIWTGYGLVDRWIRVPVLVGSRIFFSSSRRALGLPSLMSNGGSFPGVMRQGREAEDSPPTSAEVKKMWIYISTTPYIFMA
jgi:hypothetical protein